MDKPQLYVILPDQFEPSLMGSLLPRVFDAAPVACVRFGGGMQSRENLTKQADFIREIAHPFEIPVVIETHISLVSPLGLDGVHMTTGAKDIRKAREGLILDQILGVGAGQSKHDGMIAGEIGADYVSFHPVGGLGLWEATVPRELFEWWSEMIEIPVVAEGGLSHALCEDLAPVVDFFALSAEIWSSDDPAKALRSYADLF